MRTEVISTTDVAAAWGYKTAHAQIKAFLASHLEPLFEVSVGRSRVRMYDRAKALALHVEYANYLAAQKEATMRQASAMGKLRQEELRRAGIPNTGIGGQVANLIKSLRDKTEDLEMRLQALESALGFNNKP